MSIPLVLLADSYKVSHFKQFPKANKAVCYGTFRKGLTNIPKYLPNDKIIFTGLDYVINDILSCKITHKDVDDAKMFFETHNAGYSKFDWPEELFRKCVNEYDGYFPITIQALASGTVVSPHIPVFQITAENEFTPLVTYLETLLTMHTWYPSTVCTLSKMCKTIIKSYFLLSVDEENYDLLLSRLHDFGMRGTSSIEESIIGGMAHLLNFEGSDTMPAAFYAQMYMNNTIPVATSIPAMEHSTVLAWKNEHDAFINMTMKYGVNDGIFACVMDTYDYFNALEQAIPIICELKAAKSMLVLRPDSGDPVACVLSALFAAEKIVGTTENSKGFKVLNNVSVIQGDGIDIFTIETILQNVIESGFSAQNVAFGMGSNLLRKVDRDTCSFATKLSFIEYEDGSKRSVYKSPKTDKSKTSLPGPRIVYKDVETNEIFSEQADEYMNKGLLETVYDKRPKKNTRKTFNEIRYNIDKQWK